MFEITNFVDSFAAFSESRKGKESDWLSGLRKESFELFQQKGLPKKKDEDWLYTSLRPLSEKQLALPSGSTNGAENLLKAATFEGLETYRYVFVDGVFSTDLSFDGTPGKAVTVKPLSKAITEDKELVQKHLGSTLDQETYPFQALNSAFISEGLFIYAAEGAKLDKPLELLYLNTSCGNAFYSPRNLFIIGNNADITLLESHVADEACNYFTNSVAEIICGEKASFTSYKILRDAREATHFLTTSSHQAKESKINSITLNMGGKLTRNDIFASLDGEECKNVLRGLYNLNDKQQVDTFTRVTHKAENCYSEQLFKGVLDGKSRGVFDGRIHVTKSAQKTDAVQSNPTLLLSDDAVAYAKPQLEIYADDVKCTHAATTGQLDSEQIYYLRTRGLSETDAKAMLTYGFAGEVVEFIDLEPVREKLAAELLTLMS